MADTFLQKLWCSQAIAFYASTDNSYSAHFMEDSQKFSHVQSMKIFSRN